MKKTMKAIALTAAIAFSTAACPSLFAVTPHAHQEHDQNRDANQNRDHANYSNNEFYRTGNREGYEDYQRKQQRTEHNHKYRNDTDRQAHDYGYQEGWQGHQYNNETDRPH